MAAAGQLDSGFPRLNGDTSDSHHLEVLFQARYPILVVETTEEERFRELLEKLSVRNEWPLFVWSVADGLCRFKFGSPERVAETYSLTEALHHVHKSPQNGVFLWLDAHPFLSDPVNVRLIKNIVQRRHQVDRTMVFVSHQLTLPPELHRYATDFRLSLPTQDELRRLVREEAELWSGANGGQKVRGEAEALVQMVRLLAGLTMDDARRLVREAIQDDGAILLNDLDRIKQAKNALLNREGVLTLEQDSAGFADLGGFGGLKAWLELRRAAFLGDAALDAPKGALLTGVQGCGKSLAARCVAGSWQLPLLRLDFGALFNMYIGESERNLRHALATADAMAPCVLWVDELEKGLAGDRSSQDGGVARRMLASLLTWLAERKRPVFLMATANQIADLPPELVRKGRFDEIFFVDLPSAEDRASILRIHLTRRQLDPAGFDVEGLAALADGFSGAEIEQAIVSARYAAHAEKRELDDGLIRQELARTRPLSVLMAEPIAAMRAWAAERAVRVDALPT